MKRWISFFLALLLSLLFSFSVSAEGGKVTYSGNAGQFIFSPGGLHSPTDLFPEFKSLMPGDTVTQTVTVKNDADKEVKVKLYLRSLGASEDSKAFLSQLSLKVRHSEENEMAYMFDSNAAETAGLSDWVYLGTLYSGGEVNLDVSLSVPTSLGNEFQEQKGFLEWEFRAEELPAEADDPKPPATGDRSGIFLWCTLAVISPILLLIFIVRRRKEERETA